MESETILAPPRPKGKHWTHHLNTYTRWLHVYISMFGFLALMFFSVTGITLNHPTWFGGETAQTQTESGTLPAELFKSATTREPPSTEASSTEATPAVNELQIAETLRERHRLRGRVVEFRTSEDECTLAFKGPGYSADVLIERPSGKYEVTIVSFGLVGRWNDLHKGRDSGWMWSILIDASAVLMIISSATGLGMLLFLKRKRNSGLICTAVGAIVFMIFYWWLVP